MATHDKRIDAYIALAQPFAQPILKYLRSVVHAACPDVEEKMKWSFPHFDYKEEMMCSMAAFKNHCAFGFWKATLMKEPSLLTNARSENAMGHLGRIGSMKDLPSKKVLMSYIAKAMMLNDEGVKIKKIPVKLSGASLTVPTDLRAALKKNPKAQATFRGFSNSNKKDYILWITGAKRKETRQKRLHTAVDWMSEGKPMNWKYLKK